MDSYKSWSLTTSSLPRSIPSPEVTRLTLREGLSFFDPKRTPITFPFNLNYLHIFFGGYISPALVSALLQPTVTFAGFGLTGAGRVTGPAEPILQAIEEKAANIVRLTLSKGVSDLEKWLKRGAKETFKGDNSEFAAGEEGRRDRIVSFLGSFTNVKTVDFLSQDVPYLKHLKGPLEEIALRRSSFAHVLSSNDGNWKEHLDKLLATLKRSIELDSDDNLEEEGGESRRRHTFGFEGDIPCLPRGCPRDLGQY